MIVKDKLEELEFRFNIREKGDMVVVFLHALLHVYTPKPCVDIVKMQKMAVDCDFHRPYNGISTL